jgi:YVTN family beta-propeller protein
MTRETRRGDEGARPRFWLSMAGLLAALVPGALLGVATGCRPHDAIPEPGVVAPDAPPADDYLSPLALVVDRTGKTAYVAAETGRRILVVDMVAERVTGSIPIPDPVGGLAPSPDGARLLVAGASPEGRVHVVDLAAARVIASLPVGHTPSALAVAPDGATLYVCNRFNNSVSALDSSTGAEKARIAVLREPVACALTPDGRRLVVANHLPVGPANGDFIAAAVSVVDTAAGRVVATVVLPNGSTGVRGVGLSPDGRFAYATHILGHYQVPTTQLDRGWMCTNALSVIDVGAGTLVNTVLLDDVDLGAANPWGVAVSVDGRWIAVAHAGSHEVSLIDRPALHDRLAKAAAGEKVTDATSSAADVPSDLGFLVELRRRVKLGGKGPRGLAFAGARLVVAEYYSDTLGIVDVRPDAPPVVKYLALGVTKPLTPVRRGELIFNDADRCFQKWQSCASCHPDGRADALNWDLMNDGFGNPKNTKNMLFSHRIAPVMRLGVRATAEIAVRAGFKFIQFTTPPEEECVAVDEYLISMEPVPSPFLVEGALSPAARRGKVLFEKAGCAACHPPPLYTDQRKHDLGLGVEVDKGKSFVTPSLREVWRTAPYLYDGRAFTILEVLTRFNPEQRHGKTADLGERDLADLVEFVLSL